jgi:hypothetical protein
VAALIDPDKIAYLGVSRVTATAARVQNNKVDDKNSQEYQPDLLKVSEQAHELFEQIPHGYRSC